jgi:molybdopterin converting factor small subunit
VGCHHTSGKEQYPERRLVRIAYSSLISEFLKNMRETLEYADVLFFIPPVGKN